MITILYYNARLKAIAARNEKKKNLYIKSVVAVREKHVRGNSSEIDCDVLISWIKNTWPRRENNTFNVKSKNQYRVRDNCLWCFKIVADRSTGTDKITNDYDRVETISEY